MIHRRDFLKLVSATAASSLIPSESQSSLLAAPLRGQVRVDPRALQYAIDPRIHGHFIEHIGRVINQGLWAELLRNRNFTPSTPITPRLPTPGSRNLTVRTLVM